MRQFRILFRLHLNIMAAKKLWNVPKKMCETQFNNTASKINWNIPETVVGETQHFASKTT